MLVLLVTILDIVLQNVSYANAETERGQIAA